VSDDQYFEDLEQAIRST
jgi:hypothetical protein